MAVVSVAGGCSALQVPLSVPICTADIVHHLNVRSYELHLFTYASMVCVVVIKQWFALQGAAGPSSRFSSAAADSFSLLFVKSSYNILNAGVGCDIVTHSG